MSRLMPVELTRSQYAFRFLVFLVVLILALALMALLIAAVRASPAGEMLVIPILVVVLAFVMGLRIWGMDVPRVRNIGWSPWILLLFLVPLFGFVVQLLLFVTPSKSPAHDAERNEERNGIAKREALRDLGGQSGW